MVSDVNELPSALTGAPNPRERGANPLFGKNFAEKCVKLTEIGPRGGAHT